MTSQSSTKTLFACGHVEYKHTQASLDHTVKNIWRMIRRPFSRPTTETTLSPCRQCIEDQNREIRMRHAKEDHDRPLTANLLREGKRCAPPAKATEQTLMAVVLVGNDTSISALKNAQQQAQRTKSSTSIVLPTEEEQQAYRQRTSSTLEFLENVDRFWPEIHESHRGLVNFPPFNIPYSKYAGPERCPLCREYRDEISSCQDRQQTRLSDHYVPDPLSAEIRDVTPKNEYQPLPTSRPSARREVGEEGVDEKSEGKTRVKRGEDEFRTLIPALTADSDIADETHLRRLGIAFEEIKWGADPRENPESEEKQEASPASLKKKSEQAEEGEESGGIVHEYSQNGESDDNSTESPGDEKPEYAENKKPQQSEDERGFESESNVAGMTATETRLEVPKVEYRWRPKTQNHPSRNFDCLPDVTDPFSTEKSCDLADIPLPARRSSLPSTEAEIWLAHISKPARRLSLPISPLHIWTVDIPELEAPSSPPHLWQPTTAIAPERTGMTDQALEEENELERRWRRYYDEFLGNEADVSPPIEPNTSLWRPARPPRPEASPLIDLKSEEGREILNYIRRYFEMPNTFTAREILEVGERLADKYAEDYMAQRIQPKFAPYVRRRESRGGSSCSRKLLFINISPLAEREQQNIQNLSERLDWWPVEEAVDEDVQEQKSGRSSSCSDEGVDEAPKMVERLVRTNLTRVEVLCYYRSRWSQHRVPRAKLSPLRNETVLEDATADTTDDARELILLEEYF